MSLYVVELEADPWIRGWNFSLARYGWPVHPTILSRPELRDSNERDGEWHAVVRLPHEVVEHDGLGVPAFDGDVERLAWRPRTCSCGCGKRR